MTDLSFAYKPIRYSIKFFEVIEIHFHDSDDPARDSDGPALHNAPTFLHVPKAIFGLW